MEWVKKRTGNSMENRRLMWARLRFCGVNIEAAGKQSQFLNLYPYLWGNMRTAIVLAFFLTAMLGLCRCKKGGGAAPRADTTTKPGYTTSPPGNAPIYKGADVSWVTQMEDSGFKFYDSAGAPMECMQLLKTLGIDVIRLRVWVNPGTRYNGTADVVAKAVRAKNLGMRVMIDFHYSDTWADPGHQTTPAAWSGLAIPAIADTLYSYTVAVLDSLKAAGVSPSFVQ